MKKIISVILCLTILCSIMIYTVNAENIPNDITAEASNTFSVTEMNYETGEKTIRTFDKVALPQLSEMKPFDLPVSKTMSSRAVIGNDERIKVEDTTVYPYSAIVLLEIDWGGIFPSYATGFMISENVVVTSAHSIYKKNNGFPESVKVTPAKDGLGLWNNPYGTSKIKAAGVCKEWVDIIDNSTSNDPRYPSEDWGVVVLNNPLGRETGTITIKCPTDNELSLTLTESNIKICGYPFDSLLKEYHQYFSISHINRFDSNFIYYSADTEGGQSGSPVLDENNMAIGIHYGGETENQAVRMDQNMMYYFNLAIEDYKES